MTDKPDLTRVWAAGASPTNIEDPDVTLPGKYNAGWIAEIPTFENFNFLQQLFTQALAHISEHGIIDWDSVTTYPANAWIRSTVDNDIYISKIITTNNEPSVSATQWETLEDHIVNLITYTAADVLTKIKTVDGSGSGLDADLLDAQEGSFYRNAGNLNAGTVPTARLPTGSTTVSGITEHATNAETYAATANRSVTAVSLVGSFNDNNTESADGKQKLPGGITFQWGIATGFGDHPGNAITKTITFPTAFTTTYTGLVTPFDSNGTATINASVTSLSTTQMVIDAKEVQGGTQAWGYTWCAFGVI